MASPFPGMDPYLEGALWTSVHTQLAVEIQRQLMPLLRPRYVALTNERFVIATVDHEASSDEPRAGIYPDVSISDVSGAPLRNEAGQMVAEPLHLATVMPEASPQVSVEIRDVADRNLVTDIEILSPTNKRGDGRAEYLLRRQRLLLSSAHLVEIDLLRSGQRVPMREPLPAYPYFVFVSRASARPLIDVWPIRLDSHLPRVPVPLLEGDPDVQLDLQAALANVYTLAGYDLAIDYSVPPDPALIPADADWAKAVLERH